ncbi:MAG: hypothetical protein WCK91_02680 [bacterium]
MITKEQYLDSLVRELEIIKHLGEKVKPEQMSFKPTEKQRTLGELMQYLGYVFPAVIEGAVKNDKAVYMQYHDSSVMPTPETFAGIIDSEIAKVRELVMPLTEEQMTVEVDMWVKQTVAMHLLSALKNAVAYKMQLFLYLKQSGMPELNTMNLWVGRDPEPTM